MVLYARYYGMEAILPTKLSLINTESLYLLVKGFSQKTSNQIIRENWFLAVQLEEQWEEWITINV